MTSTIQYRQQPRLGRFRPWQQFAEWVTSTHNRIYIGWFSIKTTQEIRRIVVL